MSGSFDKTQEGQPKKALSLIVRGRKEGTEREKKMNGPEWRWRWLVVMEIDGRGNEAEVDVGGINH